MQNTEIFFFFFFSDVKIENFVGKTVIFLIILFKTLNRGGSNEYPQSIFWIKNKNNRYAPLNHSFTL